MPKFTVLLGRRAIQVHDIDQPSVRVGRDDGMDIIIDNPSVSRSHLEFRTDGSGWVVEDMGSSNGTYLDDQRISAPKPVAQGDEVGLGKFTIVFDRVVGDATPAAAATPGGAGFGGTTHIQEGEVQALLKDSLRKRRAHIVWEAGGKQGTHYLSEAPAALFGTGELADVRVPAGPKHHLLLVNEEERCAVRNLAWLAKMKVNGKTTPQARLKDGDVVEMKGLKLTFVADIA